MEFHLDVCHRHGGGFDLFKGLTVRHQREVVFLQVVFVQRRVGQHREVIKDGFGKLIGAFNGAVVEHSCADAATRIGVDRNVEVSPHFVALHRTLIDRFVAIGDVNGIALCFQKGLERFGDAIHLIPFIGTARRIGIGKLTGGGEIDQGTLCGRRPLVAVQKEAVEDGGGFGAGNGGERGDGTVRIAGDQVAQRQCHGGLGIVGNLIEVGGPNAAGGNGFGYVDLGQLLLGVADAHQHQHRILAGDGGGGRKGSVAYALDNPGLAAGLDCGEAPKFSGNVGEGLRMNAVGHHGGVALPCPMDQRCHLGTGDGGVWVQLMVLVPSEKARFHGGGKAFIRPMLAGDIPHGGDGLLGT